MTRLSLLLCALMLSVAFAQSNVRLEIAESHPVHADADERSAIIGMIENVGEVRLQFIRIDATAFDENGDEVATRFTYTNRDVLQPGERSPFTVVFNEGVRFSSYELALSAQPAFFPPRHDIEIVNSRLKPNDFFPRLEVAGTLINHNHRARFSFFGDPFVNVIAAGYDEGGQLTAVGFDYVETPVLGEEVEFSASFYRSLNPVKAYELWTEPAF